MSPAEEKLRGEILEYLARHPRAKDTIEGIVEWWLLEQRIVNAMRDVQQVLDQLVAEKLVLRQQGPDGTVHYSANPRPGQENRL